MDIVSKAINNYTSSVAFCRETYPRNARLEFSNVKTVKDVAPGTKGRVCFVNDEGNIHCALDDGRIIVVDPDKDGLCRINDDGKHKFGEIEFATVNIDGATVTRRFDSIEEIYTNWHSDDCDLPACDDKLLYLKINNTVVMENETFEDAVKALCLEPNASKEKHKTVGVDR